MSRIIVLGGCGAVGSVAVKTLVESNDFSDILIGDYNLDAARRFAEKLGDPRGKPVFVDAFNPGSVREAIHGCDIVLNCVGPFYNTVKPILEEVLAKKINYIDVCDDVDVTLEILDMDDTVRNAGIQVVLGMGNSPGITNVLGKLSSDLLLDETYSIDIYHTHGGEKIEGEGVIAHRFHCMTIDCPMFLDGELKYVKFFEEDGIALRQKFEFPLIGEVSIFPYPHPEQVTLPRHINLRQVTNKGSVLPEEYYNLIKDLCAAGLNSRDSLDVKGQNVIPFEFAVAYLLKKREYLIKKWGLEGPRGCVSVITSGEKDGVYREYRFHLFSQSEGLGEGTGIPAAVGAIMMNRNMIEDTGVMPPESFVPPLDFLKTTGEIYDLTGRKKQENPSSQIILEMVDEQGEKTPVDITQFGII